VGGEGVLPLDEVKLYLRIDSNEEDALIASFLNTAQELCEGILRFPLSEFEELPETVKQAILYAVAAMYEKREGADIKETLDVLKRLLFAYRRESW
jgi:uncharacterized phage protein (predicted DNA packaging)